MRSETCIVSPGMLTPRQQHVLQLISAMDVPSPSLLSDLEGVGPIAELEVAMENMLGKKYALALSSCTASLHTALLALGVGQADEVIVTPYSWGQSVSPVLFTGATAVFADIDPITLALDPVKVRSCITNRTKAIILVHLFGNVTDMAPFIEIEKEFGVSVIVDGAHALGVPNADGPDCWGKVACFSFGRGKLLCGGEGGLLATDDVQFYEKALLLTQHSSRISRELGPGDHTWAGELGYNYRMHPLAATLALADMNDMPTRLRHRQAVWKAIDEGIGDVSFLRRIKYAADLSRWTTYGFPITFIGKEAPMTRRALADNAQAMGVPLRCGPVGTPLHLRLRSAVMPLANHSTHLTGACPYAEDHCATQELWLLSTLDMDCLQIETGCEIGRKLRKCCE